MLASNATSMPRAYASSITECIAKKMPTNATDERTNERLTTDISLLTFRNAPEKSGISHELEGL